LIVTFSITNHATFDSRTNLNIIIGSNSVPLIMALASLAPLIAGEFDLSIGSMLELSAVLTAVLAGRDHMNAVLVLVIATLIGTLVGAFNGLLITRIGISSFIATLGTSSVVSAMSIYLTNGNVLYQGIPMKLVAFCQHTVLGIPIIAITAVVISVLCWIILEHTVYGRRLLAVGLSRKSSELMGIKPKRMLMSAFMISGTFAAIAGWLELGSVGSASAGFGSQFLLPALAAGFLGATTIKVGRFNVVGTVLAVLLVAIGISGLELNGVPSWFIPLFNGAVLIIAVGASRFASMRNRDAK
jgi:ribose transport system permease protein